MSKSVIEDSLYSIIFHEQKNKNMLIITEKEIETTNTYICNVTLYNPEMNIKKDVKALIDTGATFCGINSSITKDLKLQPYGFRTYSTTDNQKVQKSKFDFKLQFENINTIIDVTGSETPYEMAKFDMIIGVDVLRLGTLIIDKGNLTFDIK